MPNDGTNIIAAELMAVQVILVLVLKRLTTVDRAMDTAIRSGFEDAADLAEQMAIKASHSKEAIEALRIIEKLRTGVFGDHQKPE